MSLPFDRVVLDGAAERAVAALGDALRAGGDGSGGWAEALMGGAAIDGDVLAAHLPLGTVDVLVGAGLAARADRSVVLATTIVAVGGVLTAVPKVGWGDEVVYLGEDSPHLIEAVLRLAPRGDRAADLGTGTGLLAALLASRYRTVVGTDLAPSVTRAARLTVALNPVPVGHAVAICTTDVAAGLRAGAFDLVAANAPWVPMAVESAGARELFAHGGATGVELPIRFLQQGAALLRPGGVAVTLALDVELTEGGHPLRQAVDRLAADGFATAVLPTPFNRERPHLVEVMRDRQPAVSDAEHVAVVVGRPRRPGDDRQSLLVAAEALGRRWGQRSVPVP